MKILRPLWLVFILLGLLMLAGCQHATGVLNPKGLIAYEERQLLFDAVALMLIVVIPVIIMSFAFIARYHDAHHKGEYRPDWSHNTLLELLWWGIPCAIVIILGIVTWKMTHKLDPYKKIDVSGEIMQVEVIALPWKWLFIYPKQNVATVNHLVLPKQQQVEFLLTLDNVPMSAFFIPQLGSQIYVMAGMRTRLHLFADHLGTYRGQNSQYNGDGFSDMHFKVDVVEPAQLDQWFKQVRQSPKQLMANAYKELAKPVINAPVEYYSAVEPKLFHKIMHSYMMMPEEQ